MWVTSLPTAAWRSGEFLEGQLDEQSLPRCGIQASVGVEAGPVGVGVVDAEQAPPEESV